MTTTLLSIFGTKKMLWGVTGVSLFAIAITPELIVSIGGLLAIIFTGIIGIMNANATRKKLEEQTVKIDQTLAKADVIGGHVDGINTKSEAKIDAQDRELIALRQALVEEKQKAALVAQSAATAARPQPGHE